MGKVEFRNFYVYLPLLMTILIDSLGVGIVYPVFAIVFGSSSGNSYFHSLSPFMANLTYGLTIGSFPIAMLIGAPILGDLSDQIGRKKVLLLSLFGEAIGMLILGFSLFIKSLFLLILARVFTGLLAGSIGLAQAAIIDISPLDKKTVNLSLISLASSLGFTLGPWLGGVLADISCLSKIGYTGPFLFTAVMAFANGIFLIIVFKETFIVVKQPKISFLKGITQLLEGFEDKEFRYISILLFIVQLTYCMYFQTTALSLTSNFNFTTGQLGHFMSLLSVIYAFTLLILVRIAVKYLSLNRILWGALLLIATGYAIGISVKLPAIWISAIPTPIGIGLAYMTLITMYSNIADEHSQGWAMGVAASINAAGWAIGSVITGLITSISYHLVYIIILCMALACYYIILENYLKLFYFNIKPGKDR